MHVNKISWAQAFWVPAALTLVVASALARPVSLRTVPVEPLADEGLRVERAEDGLQLSWPTVDTLGVEYRVHVGTLDSLRKHGRYDHAPSCGRHQESAMFTEPSANSYFLVVPVEGGLEGSHGRNSAGESRHAPILPCH